MIFFKYIFIFCLFSVIGWVLEFLYRSIKNKKIINPGFMTGCVVPLYGFGAVILNLVCNLFVDINSNYKYLIIFSVSMFLLTILEYFTGYILLKFFNLRLWDYSKEKINYKGFICLNFSLIWGFLSLLFYIIVFPNINTIALNFINNNIGLFSLGIFVGVFIVDLCVSINLASKLIKYAKEIKEIIDLEKLKIESRVNVTRKKFWNAIYPYVSTNKYLKEKIKKLKGDL